MKRIMILILTAIGIMFLGGNVQAGLGDGLVAYYPFNGNANDESGNGYDGTVNGATLTTDRFGNADSAYSFDGINNNIELRNTSSYDMFSSFSIVAWVNFTSNSDGQSIISKHQNYIINSYNMATQNGYIVLNTNVQSTSIQTPNTYNDGDWHFVVGIYNGTTSFIYVDGDLMTSGNTEYTIGNTENIKIGSDSTLSFFNGTIDDVRIYDLALSETEIRQLYWGGGIVATDCPPSTPTGDSITINSDLSFSFDGTYSNPLTGDMDLSVDFTFFDDQNGTLLWKLENVTVQ